MGGGLQAGLTIIHCHCGLHQLKGFLSSELHLKSLTIGLGGAELVVTVSR